MKFKEYEVRKMTRKELFPYMAENHAKVFDTDLSYSPTELLTEIERENLKKLGECFEDRFELCLGVFKDGEIAGWHYGFQDNRWGFFMCNTGVMHGHRRKGIYTFLLKTILNECRSMGFQEIFSRHNATNNPVIIPKLKMGFIISGLEVSDTFGTLLQVKYYTNEKRRDIMDFRTGQKTLSMDLRSLFDL